MMYSKLTDQMLELELKSKVSQETSIQTQILHLLAEVERRRLYSKEVPSLFEYCVSILKYSHSSAQRRIDTMRALKLMPEIEHKLQTGELNLTTVSLAQGFCRLTANKDPPLHPITLATFHSPSNVRSGSETTVVAPTSILELANVATPNTSYKSITSSHLRSMVLTNSITFGLFVRHTIYAMLCIFLDLTK